MKQLLGILLLGLVALQAPAQDTKPATQEPQVEKKLELPAIDPTLDLAELASTIAPAEKEDLGLYSDAWWAAILEVEKEVKAVGGRRKKAKGDERAALDEELDAVLARRHAYEDRLEVVRKALVSKGDQAKADGIAAKVAGLSDTEDYINKAEVGEWANWAKKKLTSDRAIDFYMNVGWFIVILILARILSNIGATIVRKTVQTSRLKASNLLKDFFVNTTRKVIFFAGVVMALSKIGIDIGPLLAGIGVLGFVVGFALQGTLSNFACGVMILLYRPYDIGDVVSAAGATGTVTEMSLVSTTLTTPDNQIVIIPNSSIWGGVITNVTGNDTRRVDMTFGIGYGDDIQKALEVLNRIVASHPKVLKDPAPVIQLHQLADSSVNFVVRPWSKTGDYWTVYWDLTRAVKEGFDAAGVSIPFPQRDVHLHGLEGLTQKA